jgi:hypothetical protein
MFDPRPAGSSAIAALVLGILSIVMCGPCAGLPAAILGWNELQAIKTGSAPLAGRGFAQAGMILGLISLLWLLLGLLFFLGMLPLVWLSS